MKKTEGFSPLNNKAVKTSKFICFFFCFHRAFRSALNAAPSHPNLTIFRKNRYPQTSIQRLNFDFPVATIAVLDQRRRR